jgi:hypothetical protein
MIRTLLILVLLIAPKTGFASLFGFFNDPEDVTFYPTYGYFEAERGRWVVPIRLWVHEPRRVSESLVTSVAARLGNVDAQQKANFRYRIANFVADSESREKVVLQFDGDGERYRLRNSRGRALRTGSNGIAEGFIWLSDAAAKRLLDKQGSIDGWLTYRAVSRDHTGVGRVRLVERYGLSVISDIDDTARVTGLMSGTEAVIRNTFFRDFQAAPTMADLYSTWGGASFHYVTGSPWQLYEPLSEFLFSAGADFPEGTFHMKHVPTELLRLKTYKDLLPLLDESATYKQKVGQIGDIMRRFPGRNFILVGDSGEKDPEIYREIKRRFPERVLEIYIRDIRCDERDNPSRLEGMTPIPVPECR